MNRDQALLAIARAMRQSPDFFATLDAEAIERAVETGSDLDSAANDAFDYVRDRLEQEVTYGMSASAVQALPLWQFYDALRRAEYFGSSEEYRINDILSTRNVYLKVFDVQATVCSKNVDAAGVFSVRVQANDEDEAVRIAEPIAEQYAEAVASQLGLQPPIESGVLDAESIPTELQPTATPRIHSVSRQ